MTEQRVRTTTGTENLIDASVLDKFAGALRGDLIRPSDSSYEAARKVWNAMVDKRPALIARCTGTADVVHCVRFAREHGLLASVRGGGHNYAGLSVCEGGLMIDLSGMKEVQVHPEARTARAQAGVKLGDFDRATQAFGLATTLGVNTDTGISGLTLGGGYGWLGGKYGLACDNLLSVELVTSEGEVVTASENENQDLYWGVRGAGANLGVVTSFEYRLHPVGPVLGGMVIYPIEVANKALTVFDEFSATCPDDATTVGLLLTAPDGNPAFAIAVCYCGSVDEGENILRPLRTIAEPVADLITPQPYTQMQTLFDEAWPPGRCYYSKSSVIRRLTAPAIETFVELGQAMPTPLSAVAFQQLHGAASRVDATETAFPHRYDHFSVYVHPATDDPAESEKIIRWGREGWEAIQPFVDRAVYVNAIDDAESADQRVPEAYGPNYERLVALKRKYDPLNFLNSNQNIKLAAGAA